MPTVAEVSDLALVNDALGQLGEDPLTDLLPDSGATNALAARLLTRRIDSLLNKRAWNFATRIVDLSALTAAPPLPWTVQYELPAGTLRVVTTDLRRECYTLASVDTEAGGRRLYATRAAVRLVVVVRPDTSSFPAYFADALIADLTYWFSKPVTGQYDPVARADARFALSQAMMIDASETPSASYPTTDPRGGIAGLAGGFPGDEWGWRP